jgi:protein FrlC
LKFITVIQKCRSKIIKQENLPPLLLGFSSNGFQKTTLENALKKISSCGFSGAEILFDSPHWQDSRQHKNQVKELLEVMQRYELNINNLNANDSCLLGNAQEPNPRPVHPDATVSKAVLDWELHLLDIAVDLGSPPLCFATGPLRAKHSEEQALEQLRRHIEILVSKADKLKTPLSIEFEPEHFINSWAKLKPLLLEFKSPYFGVNFDIGHAAVAGEDIVETLKDAKDFVSNIHFEDIKDRVHVHLVPGEGDLPLIEVVNYLKSINYQKGLTVELYNHSHRADAAIEDTRDYFKAQHPELLRTL